MITLLPGYENNSVGARYSGTVTAADYHDVLVPAVSAAAAGGDPVNVVAVLGQDFDHLSFGALVRDEQIGAQFRHAWGRIAVVSDHHVLNMIVDSFGRHSKYDAKAFPLAEEDAARGWATGD
ncbi:STAS/SEC14 domain-containing protein [Gordonia iterans]|uniref:STAS/SEC14 domain-containing protein n=1 Tax=Gordonia iterans TaxID=1004901 RepID=A0A2S0KDC0_9ACTN|nr:STAS/SEC14 domain-containing protein [Gordonia iterans]AVL99640.1 STAS/SEC14 domain-containing protein [Gordonia iterans]